MIRFRFNWQVVGALRQQPKGWFMVPVGPLITQQREYIALHKAAGSEVSYHYRICNVYRVWVL